MKKLKGHDVDSDSCEKCYDYFPTLCSCGGWIHAELLVPDEDDEDWDEERILTTCSRCGGSEE